MWARRKRPSLLNDPPSFFSIDNLHGVGEKGARNPRRFVRAVLAAEQECHLPEDGGKIIIGILDILTKNNVQAFVHDLHHVGKLRSHAATAQRRLAAVTRNLAAAIRQARRRDLAEDEIDSAAHAVVELIETNLNIQAPKRYADQRRKVIYNEPQIRLSLSDPRRSEVLTDIIVSLFRVLEENSTHLQPWERPSRRRIALLVHEIICSYLPHQATRRLTPHAVRMRTQKPLSPNSE